MVNTRRQTLGVVPENRRLGKDNTIIDKSKSNMTTNRSDSRPKSRKSMAPRIAGGSSTELSTSKTPNRPKSKNGARMSMGAAGGRKSMGGGYAASHGQRADPRPISDKSYFNSCIRKVYNYLESNDYEYPIKLRDLSRPSAKDFGNIVTFLLRKIDPTFNDGTRKFEDEVSLAFKALGYPFNISKTALVAAGSPHTWPTLLLAITWLIELLECTQGVEGYCHDVSTDPSNQETKEESSNDDKTKNFDPLALEIRTDKAFMRYLERAYAAFLSGEDDAYNKLEEELVDNFEQDNMVIENEIERVTDENAALLQSVSEIAQEVEDLPQRQQRLEQLAGDLEKYHELVRQLNEHKATQAQKVEERKEELQLKEKELQEKQDMIESLKEKIRTQKYSTQDVDKISAEKAQLQQTIDKHTSTKSEIDSNISRQNLRLEKGVEGLELKIQEYNDKVNELGLDEQAYKIVLNKEKLNETEQRAVLNGVNIQKDVIPSLTTLKKELSDKTFTMRQKILELLDKQESKGDELKDISNSLSEIKQKKDMKEEMTKTEKSEHEQVLSEKLRDIEMKEERIESLKDPAALENSFALCQQKHQDLEGLRNKNLDMYEIRKTSVLNEFNEAMELVIEHKEHEDNALRELKQNLNTPTHHSR